MSTRRRSAKRSGDGTIAFPPLPKAPVPPRLPPDRRQSTAAHILGELSRAVSTQMVVTGSNLTTGFHASAVDVGSLQRTLERGLARFSGEHLEQRWPEVFDWIHRVLRVWVQRCKHMQIRRHGEAIRIELQTQDDLGYYDYGFDVFPARGRAPRDKPSP